MFRIFLLTLLQATMALFAIAQTNDPVATKILNDISAKYKNYNSLKTTFVLKVENVSGKITEEHAGTLYTKNDMFKLELSNQEIFCDGKISWTYLKDANEVQINNYDESEQSLIPSKFYTLYEKDYFYAMIEEKKVNDKVFQVIDLTPHDKEKTFFKIRLTIDKTDKSITSMKIFEKSGNRYIYDIQKMTPNLPLPESFFVFDIKKYPGIEVVDLK